MTRTPLWQAAIITLLVVIGIWFAMPNLFPRPDLIRNDDGTVQYNRFVPSYLPQGQLNLGLDLQGGQYVQIEIDRQDALVKELSDLRLAARQYAAERGFRIRFRAIPASEEIVGGLRIRLDDEGSARLMQLELIDRSPFVSVLVTDEVNVDLNMSLEQADAFYRDLQNRTVEQFRSRIDAFGLTEPTITTQGEDRVVVQIPGSAIDIDDLTSVGELRFIIVGEDQNDPNLTEFAYAPSGDGGEAGTILLDEVRSVDGKNLVSASATLNDQSTNGYYMINFRFNQAGGVELCRLTSDNQFAQMAISFDGTVLSAPTIQSPICGANGQITGDFTQAEAETLATIMRSGALPAKVSVLDDRKVGPSLGADSIAAGTTAGIIGLAGVILFMLIMYGWFGLFANVALAINMVMLFGVLSLFSATLTLPGIAGIILTVGMAVDANVLVFERIREELKRGMSVGGAIDAGYRAAMSTIIDANLTTFIAALTLAIFGAGPVRGFAITLGIGIVTSMFTALLVTRGFISVWHGRNGPEKAPI